MRSVNGATLTRPEVVERLRRCIAARRPIIAAGASTGLVAKCVELGGADLIIVYSTGKSRHMGLPTSVIGDSNEVTLRMYWEIANVVKTTPIIAGVESYDPTKLDLEQLLQPFKQAGFDGIINFPTIGMYGPRGTYWREQRESVGLGWRREVEMIEVARRLGFLTMAYVHDEPDAIDMATAGVDVMVPHAGGTAGGLTGFTAVDHQLGAGKVQKMIEATHAVSPDIICLAHGGPFAEPNDTRYLYHHTHAVGFVGASSMERIPIERAVTRHVQEFKEIPLMED